jgi:signal transduction histidine kinase
MRDGREQPAWKPGEPARVRPRTGSPEPTGEEVLLPADAVLLRADPTDGSRGYGSPMDSRNRGPGRVRGVAAQVGAVLLVVAAVVEALFAHPVSPGSIAGVLGLTAPVLWCRRWPLVAVVVAFGTLAVREGFDSDVTSEGYVPILGLLIVSYAAGRWTAGRRSRVSGVLLLGLTWAAVLLGPDPDAVAMLSSLLVTAIPALGPWSAGTAIRDREERVRQLTRLTEALEREREEGVRLSVELERTHLARELHDVLAHSITVMVVQAEAAEELLRRDLEQAERAVRQVQDSGRNALAETRQVLTDLRAGHLRRLSQVQQLVDSAREAGLDVELRIDGSPRRLSVSAEAAAFRIVQEALTNVRKHSDARHVVVTLTWSPDGLALDVTDDGTVASSREDRGGLGLRGMGERAALHGGELWAGAHPERGFAVTARLPAMEAAP